MPTIRPVRVPCYVMSVRGAIAIACWLGLASAACFRASENATLLLDGESPRWVLRYPTRVVVPVSVEYRTRETSYSHSYGDRNDVHEHIASGTVTLSEPGVATLDLASRVRTYSLLARRLDGQPWPFREVRTTLSYGLRDRALTGYVSGISTGTMFDSLLLRVLPAALPDQAVGAGASWEITEGPTKTRWTVLGERDGRVQLRGNSTSGDWSWTVDLSIDFASLRFDATLTTTRSSYDSGESTEHARVVAGHPAHVRRR